MTNGKILGVYVGLIKPPRRFAIHRAVYHGRELFELYKPNTLREFVSQLLTTLASTCPDFMHKIAQLDDEQFQQSKHKTRRYVAEHRDVLYINSEHLTKAHSDKVLGYWVAINIGHKEVSAIVGLACQAAEIKCKNISKLLL